MKLISCVNISWGAGLSLISLGTVYPLSESDVETETLDDPGITSLMMRPIAPNGCIF